MVHRFLPATNYFKEDLYWTAIQFLRFRIAFWIATEILGWTFLNQTSSAKSSEEILNCPISNLNSSIITGNTVHQSRVCHSKMTLVCTCISDILLELLWRTKNRYCQQIGNHKRLYTRLSNSVCNTVLPKRKPSYCAKSALDNLTTLHIRKEWTHLMDLKEMRNQLHNNDEQLLNA